MKRLLLTSVCLLLSVMYTWAIDFFTPKTSADYPDEKAYYVSLTIEDPNTTKVHDVVELAAFINDECRANATEKVNGTYVLRVVGDLTTDKDKPITFKAFCEGLVYEFTTLGTFSSADGEFIELTLDLLTRISMQSTINISAPTLPTTYNARENVYVMFGGWYNYSPNVFLESQMTWSMSGNTALNNYIDSIASEPGDISQDIVVPNPVLTTTANEGTTKLYLHLTGPQYDGFEQFTLKSYNAATVNISLATTPVTSITLNPTSITVNVGESIHEKLAEVGITVLPENATDKTTSWDFGNTIDWFGGNDSIVTTAGDYVVTCQSNSTPAVTADLNVHVPLPVSFNFTKEVTMDIRKSATINFTNLVGDNFDASLISVTAPWDANNGDSPFKATVAQDGKSCTLFGKYAGNFEFIVTYNGRTMKTTDNEASGTAHVNGLMTLPGNGWKWVSATYVDAGMAPLSIKKQDQSLQDFMAYVVEMRTQDELLYNDSEKGLFGHITELDPSAGMYKVRGKGDAANVINMGSDAVAASSAVWNQLALRKGYNWVTYPQEYDLELSELPNFATPEDGDMIIGQTTSAVYDANNTQWVGTGFKFEAGKGYLYYTTANAPAQLDFFFVGTPLCYQNNPSNAARKQTKLYGWELRNEGFINNMPVFIRVEGLQDAASYLIGAFVGDECRGEGTVVTDDVMLLNVAGKGGDVVTLRLMNQETGQEYQLSETISHQSMAGSLRAPLTMTSPILTGIATIPAMEQGKQHIYSISGQQLSTPRKGINIIGGKKIIR